MSKVLVGGSAVMICGYMAWWAMSDRPECPVGCGPVPTLSESETEPEPMPCPVADEAGEEEAELIEVIDLSRAYEPVRVSVPSDWREPIGPPTHHYDARPHMPYIAEDADEKGTSLANEVRSAIRGGFDWCWEAVGCRGMSPISHGGCGPK